MKKRKSSLPFNGTPEQEAKLKAKAKKVLCCLLCRKLRKFTVISR